MPFYIDDNVVLHSLKTKQYNGSLGYIVGYNKNNNRYQVNLDGCDKILEINEKNITVIKNNDKIINEIIDIVRPICVDHISNFIIIHGQYGEVIFRVYQRIETELVKYANVTTNKCHSSFIDDNIGLLKSKMLELGWHNLVEEKLDSMRYCRPRINYDYQLILYPQ